MTSPFIRQLMVAGSPQLAAFAVGGAVTYPSILLHHLNTNNTIIHLDLDTASWIGSIHGLAGIPSILMPMMMQWKGRKISFMVACLLSLAGWLVAYCAASTATLLASECLQGLGTHCLLAVSLLSMSEMIAPNLRNISMVSFYLVQTLGMASVGAVARLLHWKTISLMMIGFLALAILTACSWPESPSWLAYKGKFDKCEQTFVWLRGTDEESIKELKQMITAQKKNLSMPKRERETMKDTFKIMTQSDFYIPSIYMFLLMNLMYWSGTLVILIYSSDMIQKSTGNEEMAAFGGIIVNTILFFGVTTTTILLRYFSNKSVLLCSTFGTVVCLSCACVVTYLQSIALLPRDSLLCLYCMIAYMIVNSLGVSSIVFSMAAELMPVKHRGAGGALYVVFTCILHTSSLKISPYLFELIELWGTFLIYSLNAAICGILIWKYVPETKGRTLQEIEDYYKDLRFERRDVNSTAEKELLREI